MIKDRLHILAINSLILVICCYHISSIGYNNFIYSGDTHEIFNANSYLSLFKVYVDNNFGSFNGYDISLHFFDNVLYLVFNKYYNISTYQNIRYVFTILIVFNGCYFALKSFNLHSPILGALFLTSNTYVMGLISGGVFIYTFALSYSAAVYIFISFINFYLYGNRQNIIIIIICLSLSFLTIWLYFPLIFSLLIVSLLNYRKITYQKILFIIKVISIHFLICSPFIYSIAIDWYHTRWYLNDISISSMGNIHKNFINQLKLFFSWPIYNLWYPRYHYSYGDYLNSSFYSLGILILWANIGITIFEKRKCRTIFTIVAVLVVSILFARGPQPPTGNIFIFLYDNFTIFKIFRTPDIRFGFLVISCLGVIISYTKKFFLKCSMILSILLIGYPLYSGDVLLGKNVDGKYFDRINKLSTDHYEIQSYFNNIKYSVTYTTDPSVDYGTFKYGDQVFTGPDLLPLLLDKYYASNKKSGKIRNEFKDINLCYELVDYIIVRNDVDQNKECKLNSSELIYTTSNEMYKVYRGALPRLSAKYVINDYLIFQKYAFLSSGSFEFSEEFGNYLFNIDNGKIYILNLNEKITVNTGDKFYRINAINAIFISLLFFSLILTLCLVIFF